MSFLLTDPTALKTALKEKWIGYSIGRVLKRNYPGYSWLVKVDIENALASIHCPFISSEYGCVLHLDQHMLMIQYKATRLAGELLERFRLPRGRADDDLFHIPKSALGFTKTNILKDGGC